MGEARLEFGEVDGPKRRVALAMAKIESLISVLPSEMGKRDIADRLNRQIRPPAINVSEPFRGKIRRAGDNFRLTGLSEYFDIEFE
jgi:hypothetical protein